MKMKTTMTTKIGEMVRLDQILSYYNMNFQFANIDLCNVMDLPDFL